MVDFIFVLLLGVWSAGIGLWVLKRLGQTPDVRSDALALAVPLGLGILAQMTLALGEFGVLSPLGLLGVFVVGLGFIAWKELGLAWISRGKSEGLVQAGRSYLTWGLGALLVSTLLGTLLTALAPVTDGDALCYHLQVPKVFLWQRAVFFDPDLHETVYPLLTEMLYAVALAFRGPVACRLIQWLLGLVFAANVTAIARPSLGKRAWWAGAIALLVPAISNGMSAPLNDVALAAFGTAAIAAWLRYDVRPCSSAAIVAGALAGLALGVKYPALVLTGLLAGAIVARAFTTWVRSSSAGQDPLVPTATPRERLVHVVLFCTAALLVGGVWYLRAYIHTGNPVYPFFRHVFGGAGLDEVLDPIKRPMSVNPWNLLTALAPLTLQPDRFDSFSHQFGPIFLLFLPALFFERPPRRIVAIATLGYVFLALCLTQRQSMRFVLIAIGPMSVAVAWLCHAWYARRTLPSRLLLAIVMLALGFEASLSLARARHGSKVVLGRESTEEFLSRREPTFRVARWTAKHLPVDARIVGQDHRGYYFPRPYTMELAHRRRTGLGTRGDTAEEVVDRLRSEGFTHLLLCPPVPESAVEFDPTLGRLLAPWLAEHPPVFREEINDPDGVVRRYAIYNLAPASLAERPRVRAQR